MSKTGEWGEYKHRHMNTYGTSKFTGTGSAYVRPGKALPCFWCLLVEFVSYSTVLNSYASLLLTFGNRTANHHCTIEIHWDAHKWILDGT